MVASAALPAALELAPLTGNEKETLYAPLGCSAFTKQSSEASVGMEMAT
jgi:hypothetical protein